MLLTAEQMRRLQQDLEIPDGSEWDAYPADSAEGRWCQKAAERLRRRQEQRFPLIKAEHIPTSVDLSYPSKLSTQEAFGRILPIRRMDSACFAGNQVQRVSTSSWVSPK